MSLYDAFCNVCVCVCEYKFITSPIPCQLRNTSTFMYLYF